jgi:DHA1 family bicyclomycin/chloramphenicol resistance-like MFS transporter
MPLRDFPIGLTLVLLLGTQPVATDLYLPALPQIAAVFGGQVAQVQWTLTAYVLAFGMSQLLLGPVCDRHGRRATLLWGLALYTVSALASALAGNLAVLIACRLGQGVATAACTIALRAVIRDAYSTAAGMGTMARTYTGMGLIAILSPVVGGVLADRLGWQAPILAVALFGAVTWLIVCMSFAETSMHDASAAQIRIRTLLEHPQFLASSLLAGCSYAAAMCFLMLSPFIFIGEFGVSKVAYGMVPASCSLAFLVGTVACRSRLARGSIPQAVRIGSLLSAAGAASQLMLWLAQVRTPLALLAPQCVFMLGHGFHQPCGQAGAVAPFPRHAGRAAAASGFVITAVAFIAGQLASRGNLPASTMLVIVMSSLGTLVAAVGLFAIPYAYRGNAATSATGHAATTRYVDTKE